MIRMHNDMYKMYKKMYLEQIFSLKTSIRVKWFAIRGFSIIKKMEWRS